jgi:hypothetical protein
MDINDLPTEPQQPQSTSSPVTQKNARRVGNLSRRKLFVGAAGVGAAAVASGVTLEHWIQHAKLKPAFEGSLPENAQIGHLLRRAGFGATPQEISSYAALGYNGAVDRLLNYQQVSDDAMEQRLKLLGLDFTKLQDQQRWWLLRMAWTQRPLLEKMTLFKALLHSPQFTSEKAYRSRIKLPVEFVVGAYRALNTQTNGVGLPVQTTLMGQALFNPPNVGGWPGDKSSSLWLNSGTWMARLNLINQFLLRSTGDVGAYQPLDLQSIIDQNHIDLPEHFVDYFASFLLDGRLDQDRKAFLVNYFTTHDSTINKVRQIRLTDGANYPINRVRGTLYLLMALPEYQLN